LASPPGYPLGLARRAHRLSVGAALPAETTQARLNGGETPLPRPGRARRSV